MTVGDTVTDLQTIANGARLTIQPAAGVEWAITNLYYGGACAIHRTDGVIDLTYDTDTDAGARLSYLLNVTNAVWIELENTSGGNSVMGYDGIVTSE